MNHSSTQGQRVIIIGGAGMVGQKLLYHLIADGLGDRPIDSVCLFDVVTAPIPENAPFPVESKTGSLLDQSDIDWIAAQRADALFHLAAIVSGDAERNFERGWDINARSSWQLLEALRQEHHNSGDNYRPRLVFSSSIAVFGAPFPDKISDDFHTTPLTSYGAQKAMTELQIADYSRKGYIDGVSIRLPTVTVRPGKPNLAASSFFSGIIREPLNGQPAVLPVADTVRHWHASPRSAAGFLRHAAILESDALQNRPTLNMPGFSCTVAEQIEALRSLAGNDAVSRIALAPDPEIEAIVQNWPRDFDTVRALALGFTSECSYEDIIQVYLDDDFEPTTH